ncbi:MAG: FecR domain-containing protein, partial [Bacteroidota bacterium]
IVAMAEDFSVREILLNGEAYFSVPRKGTFEVQTAMGRVSVLGTRFSVRRRGQQLDVGCYEGSVRVSDGLQETTLKAGEQIRWTDNGPNPPEPIPAGEKKPSWSNGVSQLRNMSLGEIIGEYERQFAIEIVLDSALDLEQILTVSFPHGDPLEALDIGLSAFGLEANSLKDRKIRLRQTQ